MSRAAAGLLLAAALAAGCASALRPVDPASELGRADAAADRGAAKSLAAAARDAYERRPDPAAVAESEDLWRRAAVADPESAEAVIGLTLARIWLARNLGTETERGARASSAVEAAQWCAERDPEHPACPYYLALAVGVQAEQRRVTAVDGLKVMIRLLEQAIERHEELDHGGPRRVLSLVLVRAPGWPAGPGDPDEGLVHARRAVELFPDYPPNLLALASALDAVERPAESRRRYEASLAAARRWHEEGHPDAAEWLAEARAALD